MKVIEAASLEALNTFGVQARAALQFDIESEEDILALPAFDPARDLLLGGGSNVLLLSDVPGNVFCNRIKGRQIVDGNGRHATVEVGAGEPWHEFVRWTLDYGLCGLENLSLIPGLAGAAPIQNIGAYGVELASVLESVTAWDWQAGNWRVFDREECRFAYRDSRFKSDEPDRYLITSLRLALSKAFAPQLTYPGLLEELGSVSTNELTAKRVSDAVVRIRQRKLPDPAVQGNAGSFFKNPIIDPGMADHLRGEHPELPAWPVDKGMIKISAAWLIERCGLKGLTDGAAGVSDRHALVVVNKGGASGADIWRLARRVRDTVEESFGIRLQPEPKIVSFHN